MVDNINLVLKVAFIATNVTRDNDVMVVNPVLNGC